MTKFRNASMVGLSMAILLFASLAAAPTASAIVGTPAESTYGFMARLDLGQGQRACSAALVSPEWLLAAASCFVDDPTTERPSVGSPALPTVATIGRIDLTTTAGQKRDVVEIVPHESRDLVMARLSTAVAGIAPVSVSTAEPTPGEELLIPGFGRTTTEWSPLRMHVGRFTVASVSGGDAAVQGLAGAAVCAGDAGGPALRESGAGTVELAAVTSRSWQGGCFGTVATETRTGALETRVDDLNGWVEDVAQRGEFADFNCDGIRDIAIGDPDDVVNGVAAAGRVYVVYGGDRGSVEITQASAGVSDDPEANDRFGFSLATLDRNLDNCTDLVVGAPGETLNGRESAGLVSVISGSRTGLLNGPAGATFRLGAGTGAFASAAEWTGDQVGYSLDAGQTEARIPYLLIGAPGRNIGQAVDAGAVFYVRSTDPSIVITQSDAQLSGASELDDEFGYAVTANAQFMALGAPGETLADSVGAGQVHALRHPLMRGDVPAEVVALRQGIAGVSGEDEAGDRFGHSLDLATYRSGSSIESALAVGSPGENVVGTTPVGAIAEHGRALVFRVGVSGTWNEIREYHQGIDGVSGDIMGDDRFGEDVALANTAPGLPSTPESLLLAAGAPGDAKRKPGCIETGTSSCDVRGGSVTVFSVLGDLVEYDRYSGPGVLDSGTRSNAVGSVLAGTSDYLYVGIPRYNRGGLLPIEGVPTPGGLVVSVPWSDLLRGSAHERITFEPGVGGLSGPGMSFGAAIG
jgi:hypothetical protein